MLLSASVQCGKLCADGDSRSGYGILDVGPRARDIGSDGLEIIFDPAVAGLVCGLAVVSLVLA